MRRPFVVGNWKMNLNLADAKNLVRRLDHETVGIHNVDRGVAPPALLIIPLRPELQDTRILLGAQNMYHEPKGAFTGEISGPMLVDAGCQFVIIGHSERRQHFGEDGPLLQKKVKAALDIGLDVIYCIGETLQQRDGGETNGILVRQLHEVLIDGLDWKRITIAYEPVWAIGTGRNATQDQAQEAHQHIRLWLKNKYGPDAASQMRIQYGGSVKASNAKELMNMPDIDGALVGGASLVADEFIAIVRAAIPK